MRALLVALVLVVPSAVLAQDPAPAPARPSRTHVLGEIHVHGSAPAPITVFVPRAHVRYDRVDERHHAVDRIVDSVTHAPF